MESKTFSDMLSEQLRQWRARREDEPFIFCSAYIDHQLRQEAVETNDIRYGLNEEGILTFDGAVLRVRMNLPKLTCILYVDLDDPAVLRPILQPHIEKFEHELIYGSGNTKPTGMMRMGIDECNDYFRR